MDAALEEELVDLMTFCLENPDSGQAAAKRDRIAGVGKEIFDDGGVDALESTFFALKNRISGEIGRDPSEFRHLWNGLSDEWKF